METGFQRLSHMFKVKFFISHPVLGTHRRQRWRTLVIFVFQPITKVQKMTN